jgi:hypothetical protein
MTDGEIEQGKGKKGRIGKIANKGFVLFFF